MRIDLFLHTVNEGPTMKEFDDLKQRVADTEAGEASAVVLINGLQDQLNALAAQPTVTPADVQALADQLAADNAGLAAAVAAPGTKPAPPVA